MFVVRGLDKSPTTPIGSNMFLWVTDVIWELAETFHKNHRALLEMLTHLKRGHRSVHLYWRIITQWTPVWDNKGCFTLKVFGSAQCSQMEMKCKKFSSEILAEIPQRPAADGPHKLLSKLEWIAEKLEKQDQRSYGDDKDKDTSGYIWDGQNWIEIENELCCLISD